MNNALLIARRELSAYLSGFLGFIVLAAVLLGEGLWFNYNGIGTGARLSADVLREFFNAASGGTMILAIVLAMRLLAGEREHGTLVLLNTAPIKDSEIVGGKFLAAMGLVTLHLVLTLHMPLLVMVNGKVAAGHIVVGYAGLLLLGGAALLDQSTLFCSNASWFLMLWMVARVTDPPLNAFLSGLAIHHERQRSFMTGVLKLENVVYYVGVAYFFLLAATKTLEARRWR